MRFSVPTSVGKHQRFQGAVKPSVFIVMALLCTTFLSAYGGFEPDKYDFGEVVAGAEIHVEFVNDSYETLSDWELKTSCGCLKVPKQDQKPIRPRESRRFSLLTKVIPAESGKPQKTSVVLMANGKVVSTSKVELTLIYPKGRFSGSKASYLYLGAKASVLEFGSAKPKRLSFLTSLPAEQIRFEPLYNSKLLNVAIHRLDVRHLR